MPAGHCGSYSTYVNNPQESPEVSIVIPILMMETQRFWSWATKLEFLILYLSVVSEKENNCYV